MLAFQRGGAVVFDYGNNLRAQALEAGVAGRVRLPGLRARPSSGPSSARAAARSGGWRCPATRPTSRAPTRPSSSSSPTTPGSGAGSRWPRSACRSRACRRGSAGSATASGQGRAGLQRAGPDRRGQCADRHRARPPRRRLGRLAEPRDRGDGRRLGRGRGLAAAQRPGQHRGGRVVGLDPPRRRGRDRLLAARRDGRRGRRDAVGGREARAGPDDGSRRWACCVTSTRGTHAPFRCRASAAFGCRWSRRPDRTFGRCGSAPRVGSVAFGWPTLAYRGRTEVALLPGRFAAVLIANARHRSAVAGLVGVFMLSMSRWCPSPRTRRPRRCRSPRIGRTPA